MSVALELAPAAEPSLALAAEIVRGEGRGGQRPAVDGEVVALARRAVVLSSAAGLEVGDHAWAAFTLPDGGRVRPLVQATSRSDRGVACRLVHVFPNERRALEAYHAARATTQGY